MQGEKSRPRSARTFLVRMLLGVGVGIFIPAAIAGVLIGASSIFHASGDKSAPSTKVSTAIQSPSGGWPMLFAGSPAEPTRSPSTSVVNPEFGDLTPSEAAWFSKAELSAAGYPLGTIISSVPACLDPLRSKEASEAWQSGDIGWMRSLVGCYVLGTGLTVEWMSLRDRYHRDQTQVRLKSDDGGRTILFIAPISKEPGILERPISPIIN